MASFFQPAVFNTNSSSTNTSALATGPDTGRFLIYTNSTLAGTGLLAKWYQVIVLGIGAAALWLPLLRWIIGGIWKPIRRRREMRKRGIKFGPKQEKDVSPKKFPSPNIDFDHHGTDHKINSFGVYLRGDIDDFLALEYDLHIIDLNTCSRDTTSRWGSKRKTIVDGLRVDGSRSSPNVWGLVGEAEWSVVSSPETPLLQTVDRLRAISQSRGLAGLVVSSNIAPGSKVNDIVHQFVKSGLSCMLLEDAGNPINRVDPSLLSGVIYKNACILTNGSRRDFFQARKLRISLARHCEELKRDPNYAVAFLDLYIDKPLPSVIRRAYKFAKFHAAIIHHDAAGVVDDQKANCAVSSNPCSAFDWLKRDDIVKVFTGCEIPDERKLMYIQAQKGWINATKRTQSTVSALNRTSRNELASLEKYLPGIIRSFIRRPTSTFGSVPQSEGGFHEPVDYASQAPPRNNFWEMSSQGERLCESGCYDLREELYDNQYLAVVNTQLHLQKLEMLDALPEKELQAITDAISSSLVQPSLQGGVLENLMDGLLSENIKIYRGLDSGFCLPDGRGHFWAVSQLNSDGCLYIYTSLKTPDLLGTVIHTYLAHRGVRRRNRFEIEMSIFKSVDDRTTLHPRIAAELQSASYSELLHTMEQITVTKGDDPILDLAKEECERLLIEEASKRAWIDVHSHEFLARRITIETVLETRLQFFAKKGSKYLPRLEDMVQIYHQVDQAILSALHEADEAKLAVLSAPLIRTSSTEQYVFDDSIDLYGLMFFCSLRRRAFEELFMETTDRCPLFLQQHDQAAVFSELWVLGSQCEIYFGIRPRAVGAIVYDEYREYLHSHPPSPESWNGVDVFTAYHKAKSDDEEEPQIDFDKDKSATLKMPFRDRIAKATFLTIFCVPAIIDVALLTFLGRGLYLTAFMSLEERVMANYAVLSSLIMTAGVTGWSGSTGGFYLYQAAFHNMNHFMVQRLSGGIVLALILSICGFFAFGIQYSWYAGFIFAAYLMVLSTYLNLLGIMATMHRDGAPFKSGRTVLAKCLLVTLISPFVTSFVNGHDVIVYIPVLYLFLGVLLYSYAKLCHEWSSWPEKIPLVKESEILAWYASKENGSENTGETSSLLPGQDSHANSAAGKLFQKIKSPTPHAAADTFLKKLEEGHPYVVWLLKKESNGQPLPPAYTSTWLVQTKLALTNQQQLNRGLKEHSPFLLYRIAKYDLAQNVGLFLIALLDRWVAISMSANGHVVNVYFNARARYGVAFSLLYFLLCAVSLDVVLQRYWGKTGRRSSMKLGNIFDFEETEAKESTIEKRRWVIAIMELVWVMLCIFGLMTILLWLFVNDTNQLILYFAYIIGYSGVIIFQFNRVFTTDIRIHVQIIFLAALGGYFLGVVLHSIRPTQDFRYNDVIALCAASLASALGTWLYTDFCDDPSQEVHIMNDDAVNWKVYSQKLIGDNNCQCTIKPESLTSLKGIECLFEDGSILSEGIKSTFAKALHQTNTPIRETFARAREMLEFTLRAWERNQLRLIVVDRNSLTAAGGADVFAASTQVDGCLVIYVGMPAKDSWNNISLSAYETLLIQLVSESMLHESCEALMHLRHSDATLAELLLNRQSVISTRMAVQLAWAEPADLASIISKTNVELLRHLSLGINPNISWEETPEEVRTAIVSRVLGRRYKSTQPLKEWLMGRSESIQLHDWYVKQCLNIRYVALQKLANHGSHESIETQWNFKPQVWNAQPMTRSVSGLKVISQSAARFYEFLFLFVQFVAIVSTAGTDCGRELWYILRGSTFQFPVVWIVLKLWKVCWWLKIFLVRVILLQFDSNYKRFNEWTTYGASRTLSNGIITLCDPRFERTGFLSPNLDGVEVAIHEGTHLKPPKDPKNHQVATYDESMRLTRIINVKSTTKQDSEYQYYQYNPVDAKRKYPVSRTLRAGQEEFPVYYDERGRVTHGECLKTKTRFQFVLTYKGKPKDSVQLMRATYTSVGLQTPVVFTVYWCRPKIETNDDVQSWVSTSRVTRIVKVTPDQIEEIAFTYSHKRDPLVSKTVFARDGRQIQETENIESYKDEFNLLKRPTDLFFNDEDILFYHPKSAILGAASAAFKPTSQLSTEKRSFLSTVTSFGHSFGNKKYIARQVLSTGTLRTALWKQWTVRTDMSAIMTCFMDEMMLRKEPSLRKYWSLRDAGYFLRAKNQLAEELDLIVASVEISDEVAQKVSLAIRPSDLFVMGLSKDSNFVTTEQEEMYIDTEDRVAVIFTDTGCWPDAPGGVSNCRRDLVDGHSTIRNYALTESANEYGIPRFQIEKNLQMVKNLPLWGLDGKTPVHGLFDNLLQLQVDKRIRRTRTQEDIIEKFIPLLKTVVHGARTIKISQKDLHEYTKTFLNINLYFEENDYLTTWRSKAVQKAWREAWLCEYDDENISNPNDSFQIERPTASDFDEALELYISYFFIFSVRVPEKVPRVFQSTHHGISSLYGMILKIRRGTTWGIWDHAIMWRESCLNISTAQCILPIAVQSMLLGAMKLAANLAYLHADVILPCTAIYNP